MTADPPDGRDEMQRRINDELRNWKPSAIDQELTTLRATNERLRAALRWYADEHNYLPRASAFGDGVYAPHVITDNGWNARAALAEEKKDDR